MNQIHLQELMPNNGDKIGMMKISMMTLLNNSKENWKHDCNVIWIRLNIIG